MESRISKFLGGLLGRAGGVALFCCVVLLAGPQRVAAISVGSRVQTIDKDNVRDAPAGNFLTTRQYGVLGTVLEGPVVATLKNGTNEFVLDWFRVDFDTGIDGWVAAIGLAAIDIPPGIPTIPSPGIETTPGVLLSNNTVTLSWVAVPEATFYDLGVFDTATGAAAVNTFVDFGTHAFKITNTVVTIMAGYTATLPPGREYRWNVAAGNPAGFSAYTPVMYFRTPEAPRLSVTPTNLPLQVVGGGTLDFSVTNSGGGTLVYSASVATNAAWLTINSGATGTNGGKINVASAANLTGVQRTGTVSVVAAGATGSPVTLRIIQAGGTPLVITTAPQSLTAIVGANPGFNVAATGTALAYQWRHAGTNLVAATNATLTLTNVALLAAGSYTVVVSNAAGSVTSAPALLTVTSCVIEPPGLQALAEIRANGFALDLLGEVGRSFRVQSSADLVTWTDVTGFTSTGPTVRVFDFAGRNGSRRFYRVVSP